MSVAGSILDTACFMVSATLTSYVFATLLYRALRPPERGDRGR